MLFELNGKDYTKSVNYKGYRVEDDDVCNEWTDGFGRIHKDRYRTRAKGSFDIVFTKESDYSQFLVDLKNACVKNVLTARFYIGGQTNDIKELQVYFKLKTVKREPINTQYYLTKLNMEIEQL